MTEQEYLKETISRANKGGDAYFEMAHVIAAALLPKRLHEQLRQLVNGPIWDGDVISKADRNELIDLGLAMRVCHKGEQGHTGATYLAHTVMKEADDIKAGRIGA